MPVTIEVEPATHRYTVDGVEVPSVTQVLESVGLIDYSYIPWPTRQMALERGRVVHEAIALDLEGDLDEDSAAEARIVGYVHAARAALRALGISRPDAWEHRAYHEQLGYAGTVDLLYQDLIVDWKTNQAEYWVRFQLAAYAALVSRSPACVRRVCVELHADGSCRLLDIPAASYYDDFQTFCSALRVFREKVQRRELR